MNVIILAAGVGSRMKNLTKKKPKCFLKIDGVTLIERLMKQLRQIGVKDISIIVGYKSKSFSFKDVKYFYNNKYSSTNMFYSLMKAKKKMKKDTLIIYSDIILSNKIIKNMIKTKKEFAVGVDINWKKYWLFRFKKINSDMESLKINKKSHITEIGRETKDINDINARYIGIIKTSKKINKKIISVWKKEKNRNKLNWGISGNSLNKAYMTDLINKIINSSKNKIKCHAIKFKNGWYEFDNQKDFFNFKNYNIKPQ